MSRFGGLSCLVLMISISELTAVTAALVVVVVGGKGSSWLDLHRVRQIQGGFLTGTENRADQLKKTPCM